MKLKKWKPVVIKNPYLRNLRKNLRIILDLAVSTRLYHFIDLAEQQGTLSPEVGELSAAQGKSLLKCSSGTLCMSLRGANNSVRFATLDEDMVWNPIAKDWECISCYNYYFGSESVRNKYEQKMKKIKEKEQKIDDDLSS